MEQRIHEIDSWSKFWQYVDGIKISPEVYGLVFFGLIFWYLRREIKANDDLKLRWHRLLATVLSKKYLAWAVITVFFWYDHFVWQYDGLKFETYLTFTTAVFLTDVWQKSLGLGKKKED